jgi:hypothetical protein
MPLSATLEHYGRRLDLEIVCFTYSIRVVIGRCINLIRVSRNAFEGEYLTNNVRIHKLASISKLFFR